MDSMNKSEGCKRKSKLKCRKDGERSGRGVTFSSRCGPCGVVVAGSREMEGDIAWILAPVHTGPARP